MSSTLFCILPKDVNHVEELINSGINEFSLWFSEWIFGSELSLMIGNYEYEFEAGDTHKKPCKSINFNGKTISLEIPDNVLENCIKINAEKTKAEIDATCEPSGFLAIMKISATDTKVYCGNSVVYSKLNH